METSNQKIHETRWCNGRRPKAHWIVLAVIGGLGLAFLFGAVIMWLWNALMPVVFHLGVITYWQAFGLALLARLLFGFGHHGDHRHKWGPWRRHGRWHHGDPSMRWSYYEQYWNEEGEKAFSEYVKRKTEGQGV